MEAVDTNIVVYLYDSDDLRKRRVATELIDSIEDGVLLWQVACECLNVLRRLRGTDDGLAEGYRVIQELRTRWRFIMPDPSMIDLAMELLGRYNLSFWDSMIVAGCIYAGVQRLYTEDFNAYQQIGDLEIVNPFSA